MADEPILGYGDSGPWVVELHRLMALAGWNHDDPDDFFGETTAMCCSQGRERFNLYDEADFGKAGSRTWEFLQSYDQ